MKPNIIITTDFSNESRNAYQTAISLAKALSAKLNLVFVSQGTPILADPYSIDASIPYVDPKIEDEIINAQKAELDKELKYFEGNDIETHFVRSADSANAEIVRFAVDLKSDYIVMASHGRTGFARLIMGSIAEKVLREAPCPIVIVPTNKQI